jgi:hypothetical protein
MSDTDTAEGNGEIDSVTIDQIIGQLQNMDLLIQLNNEQYSPGLVDIIKTRIDENYKIEEELRKWAAQPPESRYPYPARYKAPTDEEIE